jgi:NADH-ubiquinone oxidoreductase chain 3
MMLGSVIFLFIFIPLLAFILLGVSILLGTHRPDAEKDSSFECGFHSFLTQNRKEFDASFFKFGMLFLLFDIEIIVLYPFSLSSYNNDIAGLSVFLAFSALLTSGFIYEFALGVLKFDSRQSGYLKVGNTGVRGNLNSS